MERRTLKQFHKDLSWSTRIYTLMTVLVIVGSYIFDAWGTNWALTVVMAIAVILFVESFAISFHRHPKTWRVVRWILLLVLLALMLISSYKSMSGFHF